MSRYGKVFPFIPRYLHQLPDMTIMDFMPKPARTFIFTFLIISTELNQISVFAYSVYHEIRIS